MNDVDGIGNVKTQEDLAVLKLNPKVYPLEVIYSAAYIMIDKAFILLDGDPEDKIVVEIRKKEDSQDVRELVKEFNDELLNYAVYKIQSEKNQKLREIIMHRILVTNNTVTDHNRPRDPAAPMQKGPEPEVHDPEGILKTWEEACKQQPPQKPSATEKKNENNFSE